MLWWVEYAVRRQVITVVRGAAREPARHRGSRLCAVAEHNAERVPAREAGA